MKLRKSVFLLSSLMMLSVGVGVTNAWNGNTVNVAEAEETTTTATITFDSGKTQRTSFSSTSQVWENEGITFTNNKASSTNAVADYSNPVRLYAKSSIEITAPGNITKIELTASSSSYANDLKSSIGANATVNGSVVTWEDAGAPTSYVCESLSAQVRLSSLTVTYSSGGEVDPVEEAFILFDGGEHGESTVEEANTKNLKYTLPEVTNITQGWRFIGWYDESDEFVGDANDEIKFDEGAEVILTAKYEEIPEGLIFDVLNQSFTGITSSSYTAWSDKVGTSGAIYSGLNAGAYQSIQLRSATDKNYSGVISTTSAGNVREVYAEFASATSNGRIINIYGSNTAYTAVSDLYDSSKQGTLLGTIKCGYNDSIEVSGNYEYVGFRSESGALYISEIQIGWEAAAPSDTYEVTINGGIGTFADDVVTSYEGTTGGESINVTLPKEDQISNPYAVQGVTTSVSFTSKLGTHNPGDTVTVSEKTDFTAVYTYSDSTVTVAQALEIAKLTGTTNTTFNVTINGTVDSIDTVYSDQYNNISFNIADDSSEEVFLCYRVSGGRELAVGDEISVTGKLVNYNSTTLEMTSGGKFTYLSEKALFNYQYDNDTTPTAVRFIGTVANVDLATVESVTLHFVKDGVAANKDVQVYTLYTSVAGQAEFAEAANTYYVVYVLNGVQSVLNQSLEVTMTVTFNNGAEALVATRTFTLGA